MSLIDLSQLITTADRLEAARADALAALLTDIAAAARAMTGDVPEAEKLSWTTKEAAAVALQAGEATADQQAMLAAEAALTGESDSDLAARIVASAAAYRQAAAVLAGVRRKYEALIAVAAAPGDLPGRADWGADLAVLVGG